MHLLKPEQCSHQEKECSCDCCADNRDYCHGRVEQFSLKEAHGGGDGQLPADRRISATDSEREHVESIAACLSSLLERAFY